MAKPLKFVDGREWKGRRQALKVRAIRRKLAMTQLEFAYNLGISNTTVCNWERGRYAPSALAERAIRDLCAQYGLDLHTMRRFA